MILPFLLVWLTLDHGLGFLLPVPSLLPSTRGLAPSTLRPPSVLSAEVGSNDTEGAAVGVAGANLVSPPTTPLWWARLRRRPASPWCAIAQSQIKDDCNEFDAKDERAIDRLIKAVGKLEVKWDGRLDKLQGGMVKLEGAVLKYERTRQIFGRVIVALLTIAGIIVPIFKDQIKSILIP